MLRDLTMTKDNLFKPGEKAVASGQYELIDSHGKPTGQEVTAIEGSPLPPTPEHQQHYRLVDPTKHKNM